MKVLALLFAALGMAVLIQEPERHDKYRDDPKAYCLHGPPLEGDTHGHECACKLTCSDDPAVAPPEDATCELFCTKSRCVCHVDAGCDGKAL